VYLCACVHIRVSVCTRVLVHVCMFVCEWMCLRAHTCGSGCVKSYLACAFTLLTHAGDIVNSKAKKEEKGREKQHTVPSIVVKLYVSKEHEDRQAAPPVV